MNQLDLFNAGRDDYLYNDIHKIRNSMDRRTRALFSEISDLQEKLIVVQRQINHLVDQGAMR